MRGGAREGRARGVATRVGSAGPSGPPRRKIGRGPGTLTRSEACNEADRPSSAPLAAEVGAGGERRSAIRLRIISTVPPPIANIRASRTMRSRGRRAAVARGAVDLERLVVTCCAISAAKVWPWPTRAGPGKPCRIRRRAMDEEPAASSGWPCRPPSSECPGSRRWRGRTGADPARTPAPPRTRPARGRGPPSPRRAAGCCTRCISRLNPSGGPTSTWSRETRQPSK